MAAFEGFVGLRPVTPLPRHFKGASSDSLVAAGSVKTVENYREHIKAKLRLRTSSELVRYAVRWELESG